MSNNFFGRVVWSDFFQSHLVVVRYQDDANWWFVLEKEPVGILKARTELSRLLDAEQRKP